MKWHSYLVGQPVFWALMVAANPGRGQVQPNDINNPNEYAFVSGHYFAPQGATNAVFTVRFPPGSRAWTGSVNFSARDGTAVSNVDYVSVSGTLSFAGGVAFRSFNVPLIPTAGQPKTILLDLTPSPIDPEPIISRSHAVLHINLPPPPDIHIRAGPNRTMILSWPDDGTNLVVEKMTPPDTGWNFVSVATSIVNGLSSVTDVPSSDQAFYRLRRVE